MKTLVKVSGKEIENAIYELCQTAYDGADGLKAGLHIWEDGSVSVSEPMSRNSYMQSTIFDFWLDCGHSDENEEESVLTEWVDYTIDSIFEQIKIQNGDSDIKIEVVW